MKTTYKILHYQGPIHVLRRWCQELLAYSFSCIHRSHTMMIDVDYLSRMHDKLVKNHTMLANAWSLADRAALPCVYKSTTLEMLLSKGKYSTKSLSPTKVHIHTSEASIAPPCKRQKVLSSDIITPRCSSPIHIHTRSTHKHIGSNWQHDSNDPILYCAEIQAYG